MRFTWALPVLLIGCTTPDPGNTRIIGHGGSGPEADWPMNSEQSLRAALDLGIDGIELDAQLTADGVLLAYHEADLSELTACSGKVNAHPWEMLQACAVIDANARFPLVRIDSLLVGLADMHPDADFTLDCKLFAQGDWWDYLHAFSDAVIELESHPRLTGRILVDCQTEDFLRLLCQKRPGFGAYLYTTEMERAPERAQALGCAGITISYDKATASGIEAVRRAGLKATLFGTRGSFAHSRAFSLKPDRLQTDRPSYAAGLRIRRD